MEQTVKHILAPVDLGDSSKRALEYVRSLADRYGARVTVFYADASLTLRSCGAMHAGNDGLHPDERRNLENVVREYASEHLGDTPYDVAVVADDPASAIANAARRCNADLIVMGTHGRHGLERVMLGSVAESVLSFADRPVVAVPAFA